MYVKPKPGRSVPDPDRGGLLPEAGREVDGNATYWQRRLDDGDVEEAEPPVASDAEPPAAVPAEASPEAPTSGKRTR